ncbi:predicted protein [Nematostella vectensis]|uniref:Aminotransferase class V domain-containing protein n=1 Tax=Nematostella vectensis TaxID=45351 RepID=A7RYW0_NEMVE|nr:L-cysteine desulfhydrase [Nematostella vectensis]XP_032240898.1 L-cysteine desulfhydrase [Nematostella vectensis]EDO43426.1 predicted protein [Nematostella vectensis]|eukprot:XP_001635489.1 predicted protein [Nematostella vectensis]
MEFLTRIVSSVAQFCTFFLLVAYVGVIKMSNIVLAYLLSPGLKKSLFGKFLLLHEFYLDSNITHVNNGSFGAVPKRVMEERLKHLYEEEGCPDGCIFYKSTDRWLEAVKSVANFINCDHRDLVFVNNATQGINAILRSLDLKEGDSVLVTNQTYGAVSMTTQEVCHSKKANLVVLNLTFRTSDLGGHSDYYVVDIVGQYRKVLQENPNIKIAIIDHITSSSALLLPVKKLLKACHDHGVMALVDGAHAPGQVSLEIDSLDADFYVGNLHKWMFAPRGTAFLWVHKKYQSQINPLAVSWNHSLGFQMKFLLQGTEDQSNIFAVEAALQYHYHLGGLENIQSHNMALCHWASNMLASKWQTETLPIPDNMRAPYMACIRLPQEIGIAYGATRPGESKARKDLFERYSICVAVTCIQSSLWCRISCHVYNCEDDYKKLAEGVLRLKQAIINGYRPPVDKHGLNSQLSSAATSVDNITSSENYASERL